MTSTFRKHLILDKVQEVHKALLAVRARGTGHDGVDSIMVNIADLQALLRSDISIANSNSTSGSAGVTPNSNGTNSNGNGNSTSPGVAATGVGCHLYSAIVLKPFLDLLRLNTLSSPYILNVLDAIQYLFQYRTIDLMEITNSTIIMDVIVALTNLKFVYTDDHMDGMVNVQVVNTLSVFLGHDFGGVLAKNAIQKIINFLIDTMMREGVYFTPSFKSVIFRVLSEYIRSLSFKMHFSTVAKLESLEYTSDILKLLIKKFKSTVNTYGSSESKDIDRGDFAVDLGITDRLNSQTRHFVVYLKLITLSLSCFDRDDWHILFQRDAKLLTLIREDLGYSLMKVASTFIRNSVVASLILTLFSTLYYSLGPCILSLNENILQLVFIRGLQELLHLLKSKLLKHVVSKFEESYFDADVLEIILDTMCNFLTSPNFLCNLFIAYDCDISKPSICEIVVGLIVDCGRLAYKLRVQSRKSLEDKLVTGAMKCYQMLINSLKSALVGDNLIKNENEGNAKEFREKIASVQLKKEQLGQATKLFSESSSKCFSFLQGCEILPTPITPKHVSNFLRTVPNLPKAQIGSYLGELGKENKSGNGQELHDVKNDKFHQEVLKNFVASFYFENLGILDALRVFLSAFRLPGEAQQIDRILVAFSDHCHQYCKESKMGLFEHCDVLYLLSFSIIMLNTDKHNPHIKAEKKMNLEQFIRNNTFYGKDYSQTKPLPRDLLESIYNSISTSPLTTEESIVTNNKICREIWIDSQLVMRLRPHLGNGYQFGWDYSKFDELTQSIGTDGVNGSQIGVFTDTSSDSSSGEDDNSFNLRGIDIKHLKICEPETSKRCVAELLCTKFAAGITAAAIDVSEHFLHTSPREIVGIAINAQDGTFVQDSPEIAYILTVLMLDVFFINGFVQETDLNDIAIVVLIELCFSTQKAPVLTPKIVNLLRGNAVDIKSFNSLLNIGTKEISTIFSNSVCSRIFIQIIITVAQHNRHHFRKSWQLIWQLLCGMRDCTILPEQMVLEPKNDDILPEALRVQFDNDISEFHTLKTRQLVEEAEEAEERDKLEKKNASSTASAFSIKSLIFGSDLSASSPSKSKLDAHGLELEKNPYALEKAKHDCGYTSSSTMDSKLGPLRRFCLTLQLNDIISDSRLLDESSLIAMLDGLLKLIHPDTNSIIAALRLPDVNAPPSLETSAEDSSYGVKLCEAESKNGEVKTSIEPSNKLTAHRRVRRNSFLQPYLDKILSGNFVISFASKAWSENVISDIIIRNRDRVHSLWSIIDLHYCFKLDDVVKPAYYVERKIVGFFKIISRVLNRSQSTADAISRLSVVFTKVVKELLEYSTSGDIALFQNEVWFSRQFSHCLWHLFTSNVATLPSLSLEQWQMLLDLVALCPWMGENASIKSFEIMAWILHEPRLVAEVPVFCVCAIQPLLESKRSPNAVSIGTVKLLYHLHARLEVLVKSENILYDDIDRDTPVLWESCWVPILKAMAAGTKDARLEVKNSALHYLSVALSDAHADTVPTGLLINIISDIFLPSISSGVYTNADPLSSMGEGLLTINHEAIVNCFRVVSVLLNKNSSKIVLYPTFDKLWIRLVALFGELLNNEAVKSQSELFSAIKQHFTSLFEEFKNLGVFATKVELLRLTEQEQRS